MSVIDVFTELMQFVKCTTDTISISKRIPIFSDDDAFAKLYAGIEAALQIKGLSSQEFAARNDLLLALPERIQAIPDGTLAASKQTGLWPASSASRPEIEIEFDSNGRFDDQYFQQTEESSQFRQEYKMRKTKQDQGLDMIAEGLDTLKNMTHDMNEELDRQVPLIDEIDTKEAEVIWALLFFFFTSGQAIL